MFGASGSVPYLFWNSNQGYPRLRDGSFCVPTQLEDSLIYRLSLFPCESFFGEAL